MTREEATSLINEAIDSLLKNDICLLELGASERSITFKLAHYIAQSPMIQLPITVDCEYNRHIADPKRLILPPKKLIGCNACSTAVFPDVLIHERNSDANNLIALEVKKPGMDITRDELKLRALQKQLGYKHVAHVILGLDKINQPIRELIWL